MPSSSEPPAAKTAAARHVATLPFGPRLQLEHYELDNGLRVLVCEDHTAPVAAYHTWFRVGSRHEHEGKTGLAHLFEHLMFNETSNLPAGAFDRRMEEAGAESNAATWLDWTHYSVSAPSDQLPLVIELEADRMRNLVLREPQVQSEKEVVANERRYRVDDDVEGTINETLWKTAFTRHAYRWPTIGWMQDIEGFTTRDCEAFYATHYAPNNATVVVVGDVRQAELLPKLVQAYGGMTRGAPPLEDPHPEPAQTSERRVELTLPTETQKLAMGYHAPALGDHDHVPLGVLAEVLFGGRASRIYRRLVTELELASEARVFLGPFAEPGLFEIYASAREAHSAEELLTIIDEELAAVTRAAVTDEELERARARLELGLVAGLESVDGRASTIGFYDTVLGRPSEAFARLDSIGRVSPSDLLRVARRYLDPQTRTLVIARPKNNPREEEAA